MYEVYGTFPKWCQVSVDLYAGWSGFVVVELAGIGFELKRPGSNWALSASLCGEGASEGYAPAVPQTPRAPGLWMSRFSVRKNATTSVSS